MRNLSKLSQIILALLFFSLFPATVKAQDTIPITVAPARQQLNIDPGTTQRTVIKYLNQSDVPLSGNLKAVDFIVTDTQGSPILLEDTKSLSSRFSAASWVTLSFEKATISPNQLLSIPIVINAPADARPGGRYIAVYFEPTGILPSANNPSLSKTGVLATSSRVVGLIYIRVNGPITENAFVSYFKVPKFTEYGPVDIEFELVNKGDYHITPKGELALFNMFNRKQDSFMLEEKNVFPDASLIYSTKLGKKIMIGKYTLNLVSLYGETDKVLTYQTTFWAFPWRLAIVIILALTIIVISIMKLLKVIKNKQNKLENKLEKEISELEELKKKYQDKVTPSGK